MAVAGFTGTRNGMTTAQISKVNELFRSLDAKTLHHGVCIGADDDAHTVAVVRKMETVGHPGVDRYGMHPTRGIAVCDTILPEKRYIERDHDIVDVSDFLVATPKGFEEERRSGTWATVRYARSVGKPVYIVFPDGSVKEN